MAKCICICVALLALCVLQACLAQPTYEVRDDRDKRSPDVPNLNVLMQNEELRKAVEDEAAKKFGPNAQIKIVSKRSPFGGIVQGFANAIANTAGQAVQQAANIAAHGANIAGQAVQQAANIAAHGANLAGHAVNQAANIAATGANLATNTAAVAADTALKTAATAAAVPGSLFGLGAGGLGSRLNPLGTLGPLGGGLIPSNTAVINGVGVPSNTVVFGTTGVPSNIVIDANGNPTGAIVVDRNVIPSTAGVVTLTTSSDD